MEKIKRYSVNYDEKIDLELIEDDNGDLVYFEDVVKEIEYWQKEYDEMYELYLNAVDGR